MNGNESGREAAFARGKADGSAGASPYQKARR